MTPKQFFYVILGINLAVLLASGAGYYFAVKYIRTTSANLSAQLAEQNAAQDQLDSLTKLQYQYNHAIIPILPLLDQALPATKNQTEILAQLQRIATNTGLQLTSISLPAPAGLPTSTSQTVATGTVLALPINFELTGSYSQLQAFLTQVENLNRYTNVTTLSVSRADKNKPITYSMTVNAYVKP